MSTFRVTAERLVIHEHPNADALELAQVGLYRAVVPKGVYQTGDVAIYVPEQAVLPDSLIEELGLVGKLAGKDKNRVKAIRLRGELSQGIVCRPSLCTADAMAVAVDDLEQSIDFSDILGITKWVPPIPVSMSGQVEPAQDLMSWCDIENIKRYPTIFESTELVTATEKVHGTCCCMTYVATTGQVLVSSKGLSERHLALVETPDNLYWRAVRSYDVDKVAQAIADEFVYTRVGIFGEVFGAGVQDLHYGRDAKSTLPGYVVFDVKVEDEHGDRWLTQRETRDIIGNRLPIVPQLYEGPYDVNVLCRLAEGQEQVSSTEANIREGLVVRSNIERRSTVTGGRAIAKFVSEAYLTRGGNATEYE